MTLRVRHIASEENETWDQLVNSSPQGSVFLLSVFLFAWVDNDPEIYLLRLGCFDDNNTLVGGQAFLYRKKLAVIRVQTITQAWSYMDTPILGGHIVQGSQEYFDIIHTLADVVRKSFLFYKIFCHPSIQDVRPLLQGGWSAEPDYAHVWDLSDPDILLNDLKERKRFRQVESVFQNLIFTDETGNAIIDEFIPFYWKTAQHIGYELRESFDRVFRVIANEMLNRDVVRFLTCRKNSGELLGVATYVLDPIRKTAYGWQLAHTPLQGGVDFIPAFYIYAIKTLYKEVSSIDIAEGLRPSLYFFKDSLGTRSTPQFSAETPHAKFWKQLIAKAKNLKAQSLKSTSN